MTDIFKSKGDDSPDSPLKSSEDVAIFSADAISEEETVPGRKQIGLFSAVFIIFNRIIGTG